MDEFFELARRVPRREKIRTGLGCDPWWSAEDTQSAEATECLQKAAAVCPVKLHGGICRLAQ